MSLTVEKLTLHPIEQQIVLEEERYQKAFKVDAKFEVLKEIRQKIKHLQAELGSKKSRISG